MLVCKKIAWWIWDMNEGETTSSEVSATEPLQDINTIRTHGTERQNIGPKIGRLFASYI